MCFYSPSASSLHSIHPSILACPLITYPLGFLFPDFTIGPLSDCTGKYVLTLQQTVGEDLGQVSCNGGMLNSMIPRRISGNSFLEAKELLAQCRKL